MNGNYGWGLPVQASTFAKDVDFGINLIHAAMILIFVLWGIFFAYLLFKYRRREGVKASYGHEGILKSLIPDFIVLLFEIGLVVLYAVPGWGRMKLHAPEPALSNNIRIVAEQFAWNIHYPGPDGKFGRISVDFIDSANVLGLDPGDPDGKDDVVTLNELHVPLGKPTLAELTSKDVIHSFFIPEFRIKQDAVPGMATPVWFEPILEGHFEISCAQLCGIGHSSMRGDVYSHSPEGFESWLKERLAENAEAAKERG